MNKKKILEHNHQQFIETIKKVSEVVVFAQVTYEFLKVTKKDVLKLAETQTVHYYITNNIYKVKRDVMVIY